MREAPDGPDEGDGPAGPQPSAQSRRAARPRLVRERRRQRERGRAPRRDPDDAPLGEEGISGRLAGEGADLHRSHHARRRRHARTRPPPLRQGAPAAERRPPSRPRPDRRAPDRRRGLRLSDDGRPRGRGARGLRHSGRLGRDRLSRRAHAAQAAARGDPLRGRRRRARDRHRHHPRPCARPRLDRALRRGRGDARGLRRRRI